MVMRRNEAVKEKKSKLTLVLGLATLVCLIFAVVFYIKSGSESVDYEIVKVRVVSAETVTYRSGGNTYDRYEIVVRYEGVDYDLENAHNTYSYRVGNTVDAYMAGGRFYANVEGVQNSSFLSKVYFGFLFGTFGCFIFWICSFMKK